MLTTLRGSLWRSSITRIEQLDIPSTTRWHHKVIEAGMALKREYACCQSKWQPAYEIRRLALMQIDVE